MLALAVERMEVGKRPKARLITYTLHPLHFFLSVYFSCVVRAWESNMWPQPSPTTSSSKRVHFIVKMEHKDMTITLISLRPFSGRVHLHLWRASASVSGHFTCDWLRHGLEAQRLWGWKWQGCQEVRLWYTSQEEQEKTKTGKGTDVILPGVVLTESLVSHVALINRSRRSSTPPEPSSSPTYSWLALVLPASSATCRFRYKTTCVS